jgi:alpha-1,6-mannosyltransferase
MHFVDTTMFFCSKGGGVKQYLLAKRAWLTKLATPVRHTLLVPGPQADFHGIDECRGGSIPLLDGYRFPLSVRRWRNALCDLRPDLIEAGDPYVPGLAVREAGQRLGVPVVAFFHSDVPRMLSQRVGSWIEPAARAYLRALYAGYDLVLAPSHAMLEKLHAWGIQNAVVQPLGVDVQTFDPALKDYALRREIGVTPDTRLLVYAGRFAREKNLHVLRGAVEKLGEPYHLLLVGADRVARVARQITHWPYEREAPRLARVLASCDALVHAGDQETFGLIAIEAMACGLPVVAVGIGGIKELIDDSVGVLAERPDVSEMAGAIEALFQRDVGQLSVQARARALRSYSWNAAFRRLGQHYSSLAGHQIGQWELRAHPEH